MKKVFIDYTSYSSDEWFTINYIGTDYVTSVQKFRENLKDSLECGPDDLHSFNLVYVNLRNKDYEKLMKLQQHNSFYYGEDEYNFIQYLIREYDLESDSKVICCDDNSGNLEMIRIYCEEHNLDYDDCDVWEQVSELLWEQDTKLGEEYLDKYLDKWYKI